MPKVAIYAQDGELMGMIDAPVWFLTNPPRVAHLGLTPPIPEHPSQPPLQHSIRMSYLTVLVEPLKIGNAIAPLLLCSIPDKAAVAQYLSSRSGDPYLRS